MEFEGTIYVAYGDNGSQGAGAQDATTMPSRILFVFTDENVMRQFLKDFEENFKNRKDPTILGIFAEGKDSVLFGYDKVTRIE